MKLVSCSECEPGDKGVAEYNKHNNCFFCDTCGISAPNSYGGTIEDAAKAWNDCNTETVDHRAENEQLRADLTRTIIEAGEVLKHHTALMAHADSLRGELINANVQLHELNCNPRITESIETVLKATPEQSLNFIEAGAVRKAAKILCTSMAGKVLVSHTKLNDYADRLEQMK
jgi:hypothetical protein